MASLEEQIAALQAEILEIRQTLFRSGIASAGHSRAHSHEDHMPATWGDVLMAGSGGAWTSLAAGTAGKVLTTQGAGANPTWGDGGAVKTHEVISPISPCSIGIELAVLGAGAPTSAVAVQNRAYLIPFTLDESITVAKMFVINGATSNGNLDVGIYNETYAKQVSMGSTAQGTISVIQEFDIADTVLAAGRYYLAVVSDSATGTLQCWSPAVASKQALGCAQMEAAFPLPATFVPVVKSAALIPWVGLSLRTLVA